MLAKGTTFVRENGEVMAVVNVLSDGERCVVTNEANTYWDVMSVEAIRDCPLYDFGAPRKGDFVRYQDTVYLMATDTKMQTLGQRFNLPSEGVTVVRRFQVGHTVSISNIIYTITDIQRNPSEYADIDVQELERPHHLGLTEYTPIYH
jgi:hypothetical protein